MYHRQGVKGGKVCGLYRENGDAIGFRILNKIRRVPVNIQFSYAEFDGDFPGGRYAQVHGVGTVADDLASGSRQPRVAAEKPNSGVGASEATDLADRTSSARTVPAAVTVCYVPYFFFAHITASKPHYAHVAHFTSLSFFDSFSIKAPIINLRKGL